jgi:hypothetical protein
LFSGNLPVICLSTIQPGYSGVNPRGMIANPEVTHFPGSHNIFRILHSFFEWCNRINAVDNHQDYQLTLKAGYPVI